MTGYVFRIRAYQLKFKVFLQNTSLKKRSQKIDSLQSETIPKYSIASLRRDFWELCNLTPNELLTFTAVANTHFYTPVSTN